MTDRLTPDADDLVYRLRHAWREDDTVVCDEAAYRIEALNDERDALKARVADAEHSLSIAVADYANEKARAEAAEAENARLLSLVEANQSQHSHLCRFCGHAYTPGPLECEDCPKCGSDGRAQPDAALAPVEAKHTTGPETYDDALERLAAKSGRSRVPDDYDSDNEG